MTTIKKVFEKGAIPICFAANSDFIPFTAVMIQSIIERRNSDDCYDVIVLYTDVEEDMINKTVSLAEGIDNVSIRFVNISETVDEIDLFVESVYTGTTYSREAYYRLLIPSLMPDYDKVLYFDGDMIAVSDVAELYHTTDMTGYMLASSRDYAGICNCYIDGDDRRDYRSRVLGLKNIDNYIISGMLVFNVAEFNKRYTAEELMKICASRDWRQHDQDVLNVICEDSLLLVDGAWDFLEDGGNMRYLPTYLKEEYDKTAENVKIIHFAGPRKPWKNNKTFGLEEFWRSCYKTPFFAHIFKLVTGNHGYKNYVMQMLTGRPSSIAFLDSNAIVYGENLVIARMSDIYTKLDRIELRDGSLTVEGYANLIAVEDLADVEVLLSVGGKLHSCRITKRECSEYRGDKLIYKGVPFVGTVKFDPSVQSAVKVVVRLYGEHNVVMGNLRYGPFCPVNTTAEKYYYRNGVMMTATASQINLFPAGRRAIISHELKYLRTLQSLKIKLKRMLRHLYKAFSRKELWLVADRYNAANDNGEAFFKYLLKTKPRGIKPYFVISKSSADFKRMSAIGPTIALESRKFRFYRIFADKIISAHCDKEVCFDYDTYEMSDIIADQTIVFLQHGIIKDDLSAIYSRYRQNMDVFVTSAKKEYDSIAYNESYGCGEAVTALTGLPRYDLLEDRSERIITVMPTWRRYCLEQMNGVWKLNEGFESTEYFRFYNALLSDERLLDAARRNGYRIDFIPHTLMSDALDRFASSDVVRVVGKCNYSDVFSKTALLLTDYSSTAFDVAYLQKPVVYTHFDKKIFFEHQYSEGYFNYERDGFGEVEYDLDATVERLVEYMDGGCALKEKYRERISGFYAYCDRNNCKRVFDRIATIDK